MGGYSSTPASPQPSPDIRILGRVEDEESGPGAEPGPPSSGAGSEPKPDTRKSEKSDTHRSGKSDTHKSERSDACRSERSDACRSERSSRASPAPVPSFRYRERACRSVDDDEHEGGDAECEDEDDDEEDCDDDEDDDECEEDDGDDEEDCDDEEDDDDDEEEDEEDCENTVFSPCRDPPVEESGASSDGGRGDVEGKSSSQKASAFSPCRDLVPEPRQSRENLRQTPSAFSPCRDPAVETKESKRKSPLRSPPAFLPCRDLVSESRDPAESLRQSPKLFIPFQYPPSDANASQEINIGADSSPATKTQKKEEEIALETKAEIALETKVPPLDENPCKEPKNVDKAEKSRPSSRKWLSQGKDPLNKEQSTKANYQSKVKYEIVKPKCLRASPKKDVEKLEDEIKHPENPTKTEEEAIPQTPAALESHDKNTACKDKAICTAGPEESAEKETNAHQKEDTNQKEKQDGKEGDEALYGEKIKDLQKGCAYLSKKELRKVCDKYQGYGYVNEAACDDEWGEITVAETVGADFSPTRGQVSQDHCECSGSESPSSPAVDCGDKTELDSLGQGDRPGQSSLSQGEAAETNDKINCEVAELTADRGASAAAGESGHGRQEELSEPQHTLIRDRLTQSVSQVLDGPVDKKGSKGPATSTSGTSKWQPKSGPHEVDIITNRPSTVQPAHANKKHTNELKKSSPTRGYANKKHTEELNKSNSNSLHATAAELPEIIIESKELGKDSEGQHFYDKSNSNSICLSEQTDPEHAGDDQPQVDCVSVNVNVPAEQGTAPVVDDLWFDCWEAEFSPGETTENSSWFENSTGAEDILQGIQFQQDIDHLPNAHLFDILSHDEYGALCRNSSRDWAWQRGPYLCEDDTDITIPIGCGASDASPNHQNKIGLLQGSVERPALNHEVASKGSVENSGRLNESYSCKNSQVISETHIVNYQTTAHHLLRASSSLPEQRTAMPVKNVASLIDENKNSNADDLLHHKKQMSKEKVDRSAQVTPPPTPKNQTTEAGTYVPDSDIALAFGLSDTEIKQLTGTLKSIPGQRIARLENVGKQMFDIDAAREMGLSRKQVKVLVDASCQAGQDDSNALDLDVDLAREMGLYPSQIEKLVSSRTPTTRAKFMAMMGVAPFDLDFALSIGLTADQVRQLIISSIEISRVSGGNPPGTKGHKTNQQAESLDEQGILFDDKLARSFGLTSDQIRMLAHSSVQESPKPSAFFDEELAKQMGLSEDQVQLLAYRAAQQMLTQSMNDPDLAPQMGFPVDSINQGHFSGQTKQLADSSTQASRSVLDVDLARKMGLSERQIRVLIESPSQANRAGSDPLLYKGQQVFDMAAARALGLHTREIAQLAEVSRTGTQSPDSLNVQRRYTHGMGASGRSYHPKSQQTPNPKSSDPAKNRRLRHGTAPPNAQDWNRLKAPRQQSNTSQQYQAYGDGAGAKDSLLRKRQLMAKLRASVHDGDKVNDVLTTLLEWNSILLVVIFLLLLATSCPGVARSVLPCPLPSACQAMHQYIIAPLGIDHAWRSWTGPDVPPVKDARPAWKPRAWGEVFGCEQSSPPTGLVYIALYRLGKTAALAIRDFSNYVFNGVIMPLLYLPLVVGAPLMEMLLNALVCTLRTMLYLGFYFCGTLLGLPVPKSVSNTRAESHSGTFSLLSTGTKSAESSTSDKADHDKWYLGHTGDSVDEQELATRQGSYSYSSEREVHVGQPFSPDQVEPATPDLQHLHAHGGFLFYVGFDPPKKGCEYSTLTSFFLWLLWSLPEECA